jgi:hypothetical protein
MPTPTYTPLATITLGSSASSITFSSIPATYRDLVLVVNATIPNEGVPRARVNGDSGSNYSRVDMYAEPSGVYSNAATQTYFDLGRSGTGFTGSLFMCVINFMDYSATDKHKTVLGRNSDDNTRALAATAQRWANTAAINQIQVILSANTYAAGSTFSLYGIKA